MQVLGDLPQPLLCNIKLIEREDRELDVWMTEIRRRAEIRIGELSRDLNRAPPGPMPEDMSGRADISSKVETLAAAGISRSTANEYEQLTGGNTERAQAAAKGAVEAAFAKARETKTPVTAKALRSAIKEAIAAGLRNEMAGATCCLRPFASFLVNAVRLSAGTRGRPVRKHSRGKVFCAKMARAYFGKPIPLLFACIFRVIARHASSSSFTSDTSTSRSACHTS